MATIRPSRGLGVGPLVGHPPDSGNRHSGVVNFDVACAGGGSDLVFDSGSLWGLIRWEHGGDGAHPLVGAQCESTHETVGGIQDVSGVDELVVTFSRGCLLRFDAPGPHRDVAVAGLHECPAPIVDIVQSFGVASDRFENRLEVGRLVEERHEDAIAGGERQALGADDGCQRGQ